jgi:hypothetical protein
MLKLTIERMGAIVPPSPRTSDPCCDVWRDGDGTVYAYAENLGDEYWMHLPDLASFRFTSRGDEVAAAVTGTATDELVLDAYQRRILPMALQVSGREVLHASAVRSPAGVTALCADSETGKSTIAFGLSSRGYPVWADDLVAFEVSDHGGVAISLPFTMRLRPPAAALFKGTASVPDEEGNGHVSPGVETSPLAAICVLRRESALTSPVAVQLLPSGEAFAAVLSHAWSFGLEDADRKRRMINHYLELVARAPVFEVSFPSGLENLPATLDAIETVLVERAQPV